MVNENHSLVNHPLKLLFCPLGYKVRSFIYIGSYYITTASLILGLIWLE